MPVLKSNTITNAKLGSTEIRAVYKGCTQVWRDDNVITQPHSLIQKVPSVDGGSYKYYFYSYLYIDTPNDANDTFEIEFLMDKGWTSKSSPSNASSFAEHNGVRYYRYSIYSPIPTDVPHAWRVRLKTAPQCWSGMNADGSMMPDYPYPQIWNVFSLEERELEDG